MFKRRVKYAIGSVLMSSLYWARQIKSFFQRLFCKHEYVAIIPLLHQCVKCGKYRKFDL